MRQIVSSQFHLRPSLLNQMELPPGIDRATLQKNLLNYSSPRTGRPISSLPDQLLCLVHDPDRGAVLIFETERDPAKESPLPLDFRQLYQLLTAGS